MVVLAPQRATPYGVCRLRRCVYVSDVASRRERRFCHGAKKVNVAFGRSRPKYVDGKTVFHSGRFAMLPAFGKVGGRSPAFEGTKQAWVAGCPMVRASLELREQMS